MDQTVRLALHRVGAAGGVKGADRTRYQLIGRQRVCALTRRASGTRIGHGRTQKDAKGLTECLGYIVALYQSSVACM
jgi:hypothetical protein